jgi:hypothetical protein
MGFEPKILAFERAKIVHALDRAPTVIRDYGSCPWKNISSNMLENFRKNAVIYPIHYIIFKIKMVHTGRLYFQNKF